MTALNRLAFILLAAFLLMSGHVGGVHAQQSMPAQLSQETVRALQDALNKQGMQVGVDGVLGEATRNAIRKYQSQHHLPVTGEPDKATLDKLGVAAPAQTGQMPQGPQQAMPPQGAQMQGMMSPQMMQMMQGSGGMPMGGGQQMGGQGRMPMAGIGGAGMGRDDMPGPMAMMPSMIYGNPSAELTPERVKTIIEGLLAWHGNPRLKVGKVAAEGSEIVGEIVTQDGSLVQRLAFNRHPGMMRQVP